MIFRKLLYSFFAIAALVSSNQAHAETDVRTNFSKYDRAFSLFTLAFAMEVVPSSHTVTFESSMFRDFWQQKGIQSKGVRGAVTFTPTRRRYTDDPAQLCRTVTLALTNDAGREYGSETFHPCLTSSPVASKHRRFARMTEWRVGTGRKDPTGRYEYAHRFTVWVPETTDMDSCQKLSFMFFLASAETLNGSALFCQTDKFFWVMKGWQIDGTSDIGRHR